MPCTSSHFSLEAARHEPLEIAARVQAGAAQLAEERNGASTLDQSGMREVQ